MLVGSITIQEGNLAFVISVRISITLGISVNANCCC